MGAVPKALARMTGPVPGEVVPLPARATYDPISAPWWPGSCKPASWPVTRKEAGENKELKADCWTTVGLSYRYLRECN
jgi:hypothetical protein